MTSTEKPVWAGEFEETMSKLLEPVIKLSNKKWLRQILLYCFAKDDKGINLFAHDYSAVVYA